MFSGKKSKCNKKYKFLNEFG